MVVMKVGCCGKVLRLQLARVLAQLSLASDFQISEFYIFEFQNSRI